MTFPKPYARRHDGTRRMNGGGEKSKIGTMKPTMKRSTDRGCRKYHRIEWSGRAKEIALPRIGGEAS